VQAIREVQIFPRVISKTQVLKQGYVSQFSRSPSLTTAHNLYAFENFKETGGVAANVADDQPQQNSSVWLTFAWFGTANVRRFEYLVLDLIWKPLPSEAVVWVAQAWNWCAAGCGDRDIHFTRFAPLSHEQDSPHSHSLPARQFFFRKSCTEYSLPHVILYRDLSTRRPQTIGPPSYAPWLIFSSKVGSKYLSHNYCCCVGRCWSRNWDLTYICTYIHIFKYTYLYM